MKIPRYWAKGTSHFAEIRGKAMQLNCWRWSDNSLREAQRNADEASEALTSSIAASGDFPDHYLYGTADRPLREEVVQTIAGDWQDDPAVVTRNLYGALILNAARAMFIDVDYPIHPVGGLIRRLFKK